MFCSHCGKQIAEDARFCPSCGAQVAQPAQSEPRAQTPQNEPKAEPVQAQPAQQQTPPQPEPVQTPQSGPVYQTTPSPQPTQLGTKWLTVLPFLLGIGAIMNFVTIIRILGSGVSLGDMFSVPTAGPIFAAKENWLPVRVRAVWLSDRCERHRVFVHDGILWRRPDLHCHRHHRRRRNAGCQCYIFQQAQASL